MEDEKKVDTESSATDDKGEGGEGEAKANKADDFDYKAEYEKIKSQTEKSDYTFEKLRKENREMRDKLKELDGGGNDDSQDDSKDKITKEDFENLRKELRGDKLGQEISKLTDNSYAQELIKIKLEQYPGMSIDDAWVLVNKGKFEKQLSEVKKSKDSDARKGNGAGSGQKDQDSKEPQLSPDDMKIIQRMELKWDGDKFAKAGARFALKLVNGKLEQISIPKK